MWTCTECYAQIDENHRNRHRGWHDSMKKRIDELEGMIRRK